MVQINENFLKLPGSYLFSEVNRRIETYTRAHPDRPVTRLSMGDVSRPLVPAVVEAMHRAVAEMGTESGFRGYGPEQGYPFLRNAIARDYRENGVDITPEEIFISDGAKSDCGSIGDLFGPDNVVAVCDPVYPVYVDASAMSGRAGEYDQNLGRWTRLRYLPCLKENNFLPELPSERADLVWLCFPNNPTGAAATREQLKLWVDWANDNGAVLLYDSAYEAFITDPAVPHSIFEVDGAKTCAIEFRSFSKTAGFTGTRCAYTVIPDELERGGVKLNRLWARRQSSRFNGVPYVVQRGAEAVYSETGRKQVRENIRYYQWNARTMQMRLAEMGLTCGGGENSPYIWLKTPNHIKSWDFFQLLLEQAQVAVTPGVGFGPGGEGYVRLSAFGRAEDTGAALDRMGHIL